MKELKLSNIAKNIKRPLIMGGGVIAGVAIQRQVKKIFDSQTLKGYLGETTGNFLKDYASPLITMGIGAIAYTTQKEEFIKDISMGVIASAPVVFAAQKIFKKDFLSGNEVDGTSGSDYSGDDYSRPVLPEVAGNEAIGNPNLYTEPYSETTDGLDSDLGNYDDNDDANVI